MHTITMKLPLSLAISPYDHVRELRPQGIELTVLELQIEEKPGTEPALAPGVGRSGDRFGLVGDGTVPCRVADVAGGEVTTRRILRR